MNVRFPGSGKGKITKTDTNGDIWVQYDSQTGQTLIKKKDVDKFVSK